MVPLLQVLLQGLVPDALIMHDAEVLPSQVALSSLSGGFKVNFDRTGVDLVDE